MLLHHHRGRRPPPFVVDPDILPPATKDAAPRRPVHQGICLSLSDDGFEMGSPTTDASPKKSKENLDRFIPDRSAMNFGFAHHMLFQGRKGKENHAASSPSKEAYQRQLRKVFGMNRTRILAFKNRPPALVEQDFYTYFCQSKPAKPQCYIPQTSKRTLDALIS